jgi:hypothetical protein
LKDDIVIIGKLINGVMSPYDHQLLPTMTRKKDKKSFLSFLPSFLPSFKKYLLF